MVLDLLFTPYTLFSWKELLSTDDLVPLYIGIKTNFITAPHLHGSWLNIVEFRRDVDNLLQRLIFFSLTPWVFNFFFACILFGILVISITESLASFLLMSWYIKYIFWNIDHTSLGLLWFYLLWMRPDNFIIPFLELFLSLWFWLLLIYLYNDFSEIINCGTWWNITDMIYFTHTMELLLQIIYEDVFIFWQYMCTVH